ncbi:DUF3108 domain-containing protein [Spirochaetota bacterium]
MIFFIMLCLSFMLSTELYGSADLFHVGEELHYDIKVLGIRVGKQITTITNIEKIKGVDAYHLWSKTFSLGIIKHLYKLVDIFETWIDCSTYKPLYVKRTIHEGKWRDSITMDFDYTNKTCRVVCKRYNKGRSIAIDDNAIELLSLIYTVRKFDIENTTNIMLRHLIPYPLKKEDIHFEIKKGKKHSFKYNLISKKQKIKVKSLCMKQKGGHGILVYVAPDLYNIPVRIVLPVLKIGGWGVIDVDGILRSYSRQKE